MAALIGKQAILPLVGRSIPIVGDTYADPEKGTGAVKITPAHDFNDFEVGRGTTCRCRRCSTARRMVTLAEIEDVLAAVPGVADPGLRARLAGQSRFAARSAIVAELERLELLDKVEPHTNQVPHGDRGGVPVEPLLTTQWYCNAGVLAKPAIEAVETGQDRVRAEAMGKHVLCLDARHPALVHLAPALVGAPHSGLVRPGRHGVRRQGCGGRGGAGAARITATSEALAQDEDVLDTWFSSGAVAVLDARLAGTDPGSWHRYYPGDVLVTGFDIIFFWVARMMMMGLHMMGDVPFRTVYIHGLVRDEKGQKCRSRRGNVIDPLELIDSLRRRRAALHHLRADRPGPRRQAERGTRGETTAASSPSCGTPRGSAR